MFERSSNCVRATVLFALVALCSAVSAQDTTRILVQVSTLKPERVAEWRALQ
jgi:hypothetical protein